jgi:hypothetical protein
MYNSLSRFFPLSFSLVAFFDAADALDEHNLVEHRSQSAVLILDPTNNTKTLDMPQDPTFWNQSKTYLKRLKNIGCCIVGYNIGCRFITSNP